MSSDPGSSGRRPIYWATTQGRHDDGRPREDRGAAGGDDAWSADHDRLDRAEPLANPARSPKERVIADHGIFIGWGGLVSGRERQSRQVFGDALAHIAEQEQAGNIESHEVVLLSAHGGDLQGFMLMRGERASAGCGSAR